MIWFDVDAALSEVPINLMPLLDDTDFKSKEESVAYNAAGLDLVWNFITTAGAFTQTAVTPTDTGGNYDWVNQGNGHYSIEIPASGGASINNDTEGFGWFTGVATGVLPWRSPEFGFRAAALNNSLIDGATIDVNVTAMAAGVVTATVIADNAIDAGAIATGAIDADAIADNAIDANAIATGAITNAKFAAGAIDAAAIADNAIDAGAIATGAITNAKFAAGAIDASAIAADAIDADALKTDAITEIQAGLATPTNITAGTITTVTNLTNLPAVSTDWLTAAGVKADAVTKIQTGLATSTALATVDANVDAILDDTGTTGVLLSTSALGSIFDDEAVVGSYTMRQLLKVFAAALAGKATGGGTTTITFRGVDDASNVIVATVDASGNRSAVTLTV